MFLTAQAETPIEGEAWGQLFQYNCSIVSSFSEMSILKRRKSAKENGIYNSPARERMYPVRDKTSNILIWNQTNAREMFWVTNLHAVIELGYRSWDGPGVLDEVYAPNLEARNYSQTDCYFNKIGSPLLNYPGIDSTGTFEVLL